MLHIRSGFLLALAASGCGIRFAACDPPRSIEHVPVKLWSCTALERRCEVYARFKTAMDCELYRQILDSECDPAAPPGELHCRKTARAAFRNEWFSECTRGDLAFADVRDGGVWIR